MDIRRTGQEHVGNNSSPTSNKLAKRRKEDRRRTSSSSSAGSQTEEKNMSVLPDASVLPIEISGNLHKQGRLLKKWKPRFFQVQGSNLYYFKNYEKRECLGLIDLQKCYYVGKSSAASFGFAFELQTWGRTHLLAARDERDAEKWIKVLKKKMVPEARDRDKKGSKEEIDATIPDVARTRRATIKMAGRAGRKGNVKPSASAHEMTLKCLEEDAEDDETGEVADTIPNSQSFPKLKSDQINPVSTSHANTLPNNQKENRQSSSTVTTVSSKVQQPAPQIPSKMDVPPSSVLPAKSVDQLPPTMAPLESKDSIPDVNASPSKTSTPLSVAEVELPPPPSFVPINRSDIKTEQPLKGLRQRALSVADIQLPPPPSFVPLKRSNTVTAVNQPDIHQPLPVLSIPPLPSDDASTHVPLQSDETRNIPELLPNMDNTANAQLCADSHPTADSSVMSSVSAFDVLPPPLPLDIEPQQSIPPPIDDVLPPPDVPQQSIPPPIDDVLPPIPDVSQQSIPSVDDVLPPPDVHVPVAQDIPVIEMHRLQQMVPPLNEIDHIPSAIEQLRYLLSNDCEQHSGNKQQYANLPEVSQAWLSEKTAIEQLHRFLCTV